MNMQRKDLIAEAKDYTEGWVTPPSATRPHKPFDQADKIRYWDYPVETMTPIRTINRVIDIAAWEGVHGHDVRLKCSPEFECAVIQTYGISLIQRLVTELELAVKGQ